MARFAPFIKHCFKQFKATVINDIWVELLFFTGVATAVVCISEFQFDLGISNQLLTVLGTVLGLVVSFRTSSAYDRYWEGRKLWSAIALASRNLAQVIWLHVPADRKITGEMSEGEARLRNTIEKKSMINVIQAYSVSLKHLLRGEGGIYYEDLYPLVSFLPRYANAPAPGSLPSTIGTAYGKEGLKTDDNILPLWTAPNTKIPPRKPRKEGKFNPEQALPQVESDIPLRPARNPPKDTVWDFLPFLLPIRWVVRNLSKRLRDSDREAGEERTISGKRKLPPMVESNVPLEICLFLSSYLAFLLRGGLLTPALATAYTNQLQSFQDSLEHLQRVRNTPIPFAYQVHLRMSLWFYLFFLPFQVYPALEWVTIPATLFASFLILGFLEIGQEIENPFGYEPNDLDLDGFCLAIQRELHEVTAHAPLDPAEFIFSVTNQPFAPADRRSAQEMIAHGATNVDYARPGPEGWGSLRSTLVKNWKEVNEVTRELHWKHK